MVYSLRCSPLARQLKPPRIIGSLKFPVRLYSHFERRDSDNHHSVESAATSPPSPTRQLTLPVRLIDPLVLVVLRHYGDNE